MIINSKQPEKGFKRDYGQYQWERSELFAEIVRAFGVICLFSWFFYRSCWAVFPMSLVGVLYWRKRREEKIVSRKKELSLQFQECILSVSASLRAGYSVENSFLESLTDMKLLFGERAMICKELELIQKGLLVHVNLEELLRDLGQRSRTEDIREFSEVFSIAKRSGGSISEIIQSSALLIRNRSMAEEEIRTLLSARKLEQRVMNAMPFGILVYIESSSPGYFTPLYHNLNGIIIMSICLIGYLGAYLLAGRILNQASGGWQEG